MSQIEVKKKLAASRKDLLDIGLRNSMISFRSSAKSLTIVDERSEEILKILYSQKKPMTFAAMATKRLKQVAAGQASSEETGEDQDESTLALLHELDGVNWSEIMESDSGPEAKRRHTDTKLQTALPEDRLFLSLLKIHSEAETYIQEQGVNVLFLAIGFLHWYEADAAEKLRKAPLLLIPVELKRGGSKDAFRIEYTDDDLIQNLSLAARLKTEFAIDFPQYLKDPSAETDEMPPLDSFFGAIGECVSKQKRWKVAPDEIHLGFFSFGKFLMFNDLDDGIWPEGKQPSAHPVIARLLGDGFVDETAAVAEGVHLDSVIAPGEVRFVRDADSSQTLAILEARGGRNLVIQGPPGTGKSQTITNIVAELVGSGKTVLFVAEKMAALEVVKRRLDESHLGDAVLELHSHKATKQSVLKELARTLDQGQPLAPDGADEIDALKLVRDELNAYCEGVNSPIAASQVPFIKALGHYLKIKREHPTLDVWSFEPMKSWTLRDQGRRREMLEEVARHLHEAGQPSLNPFWGSSRATFSPVEQAKLTDTLNQTVARLDEFFSTAERLASRIGLHCPVTVADVRVVCRAAQRAAEAPRLQGIKLSTGDWQSRRDTIRTLLAAGKKMTDTRAVHQGMLIEQAWEQDVLADRQHFANLGDKWWRMFSGKYRQSRARLQGFCKTALPKEGRLCLALLDGILEHQQHKGIYDRHAMLGEALFGAQWVREQSDWEVLGRLSSWIFLLYDDLGKGDLPPGIVDFLAGHPDAGGLGESIAKIEDTARTLLLQIDSVIALLEIAQTISSSALLALPLGELRTQLDRWTAAIPSLYQHVRFNQLREEMTENGIGTLIDMASHWTRDADDLVRTFDFSWYAGLVALAYATTPALSKFDHIKQAHQIEKFRRLDQLSLGHAQAELAKGIWDRQPGINQPGEMAVIRNELNKKRRLMPIRQLIDQAGRAIQAIKPVFMMSPMSIANFLPPGKVEFDVVIFDEASQVKAVDAFGALLRGRQAIVVGDTRQMPPSDFFGREVELDDEDNVTSDIDSVLSMFRARGAQERYLSWHYRSRHESLIAVSNVEFYDRKLVIFPSSGTHQHAQGLKFRHLPEALYDRGRTRTNRGEAKAVALAVMTHAVQSPELSLGVVAFSVAQRDLIQIEVELLRRKHPELDDYFNNAHPTEPFFVKNLENVQGDERDSIYISIGYGRNESGKIAKEFGPVNRDGGERRLNVLISRAKMRMDVFCNFRADDLELDATASHGVRALKHFLKYAESGELDIPKETRRQADSPFEVEVMLALQERGYQLEPQVGTAGYFIDVAVKDHEHPGRYVLAIECDGASYHSSRSARDRDRLRQGVLESLGWRFHRIWSTDWFRDSRKEVERTIEAIESARAALKANKPMEVTVKPVSAPVIHRAALEVAESATTAMAYRKAVLPGWKYSEALHEAPADHLIGMIKAVTDIEAPIHESDVTKRLMDAFGVSRAGSRITEAVSSAIQQGHRGGAIHFANGFVYADKTKLANVRNRNAFEASEKKIEYVAPEELDAALLDVVRMGFSIEQDAAVTGALDSLGFGRATANISGAMKARLTSLLKKGRIKRDDGRLTIV
jgi:very-short-patch-repair endonuclease/DNA polymerase III delta prime subunit